MLEVKFWGVRGSIPISGANYMEVGGATSCVSLQAGNHCIVIDAGTGMYPLGKSLVQENQTDITLLLSHLHFDHIIGLPFFSPIWNPRSRIQIYGGPHDGISSLKSFLKDTIKPPLFPLALLDETPAQISITDLTPSEAIHPCEGVDISTLALNHPGGATGYRVTYQNQSVCYISDHEHIIGEHNDSLIRFVEKTDCLIYDAAFTPHEHEEHIGWGHSTWEEATHVAKEANVDTLVLYHHNPDHTDKTMKTIEKMAQSQFDKTLIAREGLALIFPKKN